MPPILDVVIGLIFLFLLFSLLATTVMELIAGFLALRGRLLERALEKILTTGYISRLRPLWQELLNRLSFGRLFRERRPDPEQLTQMLATQIPDPPLVGTQVLHRHLAEEEEFSSLTVTPELEQAVADLTPQAAQALMHTMKRARKVPLEEMPLDKVAQKLVQQVELNYTKALRTSKHALSMQVQSADKQGQIDVSHVKQQTIRYFFLSDYFFHSPIYQQITRPEASPKPSYLSAEAFLAILLDFFSTDEPQAKKDLKKLRDQVLLIPDSAIKRSLIYLIDQSEGSMERFKQGVRNYYDEIMDHVSGWYKRNMQAWLLVVGLIIAMIFNVNSLKVYSRLSNDPELRAAVVSQAVQYIEQNRQLLYDSTLLNLDPADQLDSNQLAQRIESLHSLMDSLIQNDFQQLNSPLGLGWENGFLQPQWTEDPANRHWIKLPPQLYFLYAIWDNLFGWLITALAICLGAPFWFDLLKKLVNIRNAPRRPDSPPTSTNTTSSSSANPSVIVLNEGYEIRKKPIG